MKDSTKTTEAARHTPGPWTYSQSSGRIGTADGTICCLQNSAGYAGIGRNLLPSEQEANARLLVAAPDLLAACEDILVAAEAYGVLAVSRQKLADAIAKARGTNAST